jgi:hypothetical protein
MVTMIPDFAGHTISAIRMDFRVLLYTEENWEFQLSSATYLTNARVGTVLIEGQEELTENVPPELKRLVGERISSVLVSKGGDLAINVGDTQLSVRADPNYEAWEMGGPKGEIILCRPGGELVTWGPRV